MKNDNKNDTITVQEEKKYKISWKIGGEASINWQTDSPPARRTRWFFKLLGMDMKVTKNEN